MITKDHIKAQIDRVSEEHLDVLYRIVKALEANPGDSSSDGALSEEQCLDWQRFVDKTYGCLRDAPIGRGKQDGYQVRGTMG